MNLLTPRDWYRRERRSPGALRLALLLTSRIWALATAHRLANARPTDPRVPVICVGNLTLGGTGKTPIVRALTAFLAAKGRRPAVLSRGHGGRSKGPVLVDLARDDAAAVGDEALMMAADGSPIWIARDRAAGALAAARAGADVIVMDDGHQNPTLAKALSLIVVDGETRDDEWPFGDGSVFPAGPLREPFAVGLSRADAVILLLPADLAEADPELLILFGDLPVLTAHLIPIAPPPPGPQIGFAGIGKPWKLERALKAAGCDLVDFAPMPDHQPIGAAALRFLADRAASLGAGLVTSEKDWARLSPPWRARVAFWPVRAVFDDEAAIETLLDRL